MTAKEHKIFREAKNYNDESKFVRLFYKKRKTDLNPIRTVELVENNFTEARCCMMLSHEDVSMNVPTKKMVLRCKTILGIVFARANFMSHTLECGWECIAYEHGKLATLDPALLEKMVDGLIYIETAVKFSRILKSIVSDDIAFDSFLARWLAIPTYEEIRAYIPLPGEIVDKIFSFT